MNNPFSTNSFGMGSTPKMKGMKAPRVKGVKAPRVGGGMRGFATSRRIGARSMARMRPVRRVR